MGEGLVDSSPSSTKSYTDIFNEQFPTYLALGMSYDQYWFKDSELVKAYRKADEIRRNRTNHEMWLQGLYFYDALNRVSPMLHAFRGENTKPEPYPSEPYPLTVQQMDERKKKIERESVKAAAAGFDAVAARFNAKLKGKGKRNGDNAGPTAN